LTFGSMCCAASRVAPNAAMSRVISFIALGLLLLAGAFAYQRLRPPPLPDMRKVHRSQR
jgi:hypothetical protein